MTDNDRHAPSTIANPPLVEVLLISSQAEQQSLRRILSHTKWNLITCDRVADAIHVLQARQLGTVVCKEMLADGTWQDLMQAVEPGPNSPKVIVASTDPNTKLWSAALTSGADYVLPLPFESSEVLRTIGEAWHRWWFARVREVRFDVQFARTHEQKAARVAAAANRESKREAQHELHSGKYHGETLVFTNERAMRAAG